MTTRTVQFWGQGYSNAPAEGLTLTPCTITATVSGNVVFSGPIATLESSDILRLPTDQQVLFTCEIPLVTTGNAYTLPVSLAVTGDDVFLEQINMNYCVIYNPVYTAEQITILNNPATTIQEKLAIWEPLANPPLSAEDITLLNSNDWTIMEPVLATHNLLTTISSGPTGFFGGDFDEVRSNVVVTNATFYNQPPDPRPEGTVGSWGWEIETAPGQTSTMTFDMNVSPGSE